MCDDGWDLIDATTVCNQLHYGNAITAYGYVFDQLLDMTLLYIYIVTLILVWELDQFGWMKSHVLLE